MSFRDTYNKVKSPNLKLMLLSAYVQGWAVDLNCPGTLSLPRKKRMAEAASFVAEELDRLSEEISRRALEDNPPSS